MVNYVIKFGYIYFFQVVANSDSEVVCRPCDLEEISLQPAVHLLDTLAGWRS